ncbi:MAG TPA: hypothetical protein VED63_04560, partial [Acidimicrobiales bacterium]|nr:hypothetical protein [Acidimicrobiales bacterium]
MSLPVSALSIAVGGSAWAKAAKPEKSITCKSFSGTVSSTVIASGCNGNTGGSSDPISATALAAGGTVKWSNGKTTTIGAPTLGTVKNKKCTGTAETVSATVTADTTGLASLGTMTTEVCIAGG